MKKLKAAIIGLGVGEQHVRGYQAHPQCELAVLCDIAEGKREGAREKYPGLKIISDPDEVLEDPNIDIVSIASYDDCHYEQIMKALRHEKHVFVEKPLCLYEEEANAIRRLLRAKNHLKIASNFILRASPRFRLVREKVQKGELGDLFYVEGDYHYGRLWKLTQGWRGEIDFYSAIYGGGIHMVDLLIWLTGDQVEEVSGYGNRIASKESRFRYNDFAVSLLKFKSGLIGKVAANMGCVHPHFHALTLYGTRATFVNGRDNGSLFRSADPLAEPEKINAEYPGAHKGNLIPNFIDSILNGTIPEVTEEDIFKAMSVCFAMEKSVKEGKPVQVRYV